MPLGRSDELGVLAAIGSFRETLDSHAQKTLAKKDDQLLELVIAKIFVSVFHEGNLRPFPNPSCSAFTVAYAIPTLSQNAYECTTLIPGNEGDTRGIRNSGRYLNELQGNSLAERVEFAGGAYIAVHVCDTQRWGVAAKRGTTFSNLQPLGRVVASLDRECLGPSRWLLGQAA